MLGQRARRISDRTTGQVVLLALGLVLVVGLVRLAHDSLLLGLLAILTATFLTGLAVIGPPRMAVFLIVLGMVLAPLTELRAIPGSTLVTLGDVCFVLGFALLIPSLLRHPVHPPPLFVAGAVVVMVMAFLASAAALHPAVSIDHMIRLVATAVAFPLIFIWWGPGLPTLAKMAGGYMAGVAASTLYGFFVEGPALNPHDPGRYDGLSEHTNALAVSCLLAAALTPFVVTHVERLLPRLLWGAVGGVCLWGIWLSGSRAALLTLLALALLYPALERSVRAAGALLAVVTVGLIFANRLLVTQSGNPVGRLLGGGTALGSDRQRENALTTGIAQVRAHPLIGNGFEYALDAHLIYLQVTVAIGLVGLVGFLMLLWPGLSSALSAVRPHNRIGYPMLAYALVGMLQPLLWDRYIWCVLAMAYVIAVKPTVAEPVVPGHLVPGAVTASRATRSS